MPEMNKVIAGDYIGFSVILSELGVSISDAFDTIAIDKSSIDSYDVIDKDISDNIKGVYLIAVYFKDGKRSLIEVDDAIHRAIIKLMF